ncbi:recombinase zinc beta ribbon domain-containing protein [Streptomyces sp. NPDC096057]
MLLSPRMVGWRVYNPTTVPLQKRDIIGPDGEPVKGQYDAILDEDVWLAVVDKRTNDDRLGAGEYSGKRKYWLSGLIRCGNCGAKMNGMAQPGNRFIYVCRDGCGKNTG